MTDIFPVSDAVERARFDAARAFFLERIERQAREEGQPITEAEREFLVKSVDAQGKAYEKLLDSIGGDKGYDALFERCAELIKRSMERENASDPAAEEVYTRQMNDLGTEDAFWSFMVYGGVKRDRANVLGRVLQIAFGFAGVAVVSVIVWLVIGVARRWLHW